MNTSKATKTVKYSNRITFAHGWEGVHKFRVAKQAKKIWVECKMLGEDPTYAPIEDWGCFDNVECAAIAIQLFMLADCDNERADAALQALVSMNDRF